MRIDTGLSGSVLWSEREVMGRATPRNTSPTPRVGRSEIVKVSPAVGSLWSRHVFTRSLINDSNVNIISLCGRRSACVRACVRAHVLACVCVCVCARMRSTQPSVYRAVISELKVVSGFTEYGVSRCIL